MIFWRWCRADSCGRRLGVAGMRPIPVLAEASALFAGVAGGLSALLALRRPMPESAVYAAAGVYALQTESLHLAFGAAIAAPELLIMWGRFAIERQRTVVEPRRY